MLPTPLSASSASSAASAARAERRTTRRLAPWIAAWLTVGLVAACGLASQPAERGSGGAPPDTTVRPTAVAAADRPLRRARVVDVVAVGDLVCPLAPREPGTCRDRATYRLARALDPDRVLVLGDLQYESGLLTDFESAYARTWGRLRGRTLPVPGNHEYYSGGAGYYAYFEGRQPGPPGWYARRLGAWRAYLLNSNCDAVDCGEQLRWLRGQLRRDAERGVRCSLMVSHHPRWSSGSHGSDAVMDPFFRAGARHGVELLLSGHDHHYERFAPLGAAGRRSPTGMRQWVVGTGGRSLYDVGDVQRGSLVRRDGRYGVSALALRPGRFAWRFVAVNGSAAGRATDRGSATCHS